MALKCLLTFIFTCLSLSTFAGSQSLKIKDVKNYVMELNPDSTCMDEYLKRRKELIIKLAASPVVLVGGTVVSTYAGALAGALSYPVVGGGGDQLAYVLGGATLGALSGIIGVGVSAVSTGVTIYNNGLILKTLASTVNGDGSDPAVSKLYKKYVKKSKVDLPQSEFINRLRNYDSQGILCDGTMVAKPRIRIGSRLKFKVAKIKDIVRYMDQN
jgi:hypothetical protein